MISFEMQIIKGSLQKASFISSGYWVYLYH
jgi:hypothetical protein